MRTLLVILHTLACVLLVVTVLLQAGRGGGVGAAFAGASGQIFGGRGANVFLVRVTSALAGIFFVTSLSLSMVSSRHRSVMQGALTAPPAAAAAPAADAAAPPAAAPTAADSPTAAPPGAAATGEAPPHAPATPGP